mgnify:CR=1 FL=1
MKILLLLSCILTLQSNDNFDVTTNRLKHYSTDDEDSNPKKCHVDTDQQLPTSLCKRIPLINPQQIINSMFTFNGNKYSNNPNSLSNPCFLLTNLSFSFN